MSGILSAGIHTSAMLSKVSQERYIEGLDLLVGEEFVGTSSRE